ncbi:hypothetical protein [Streptomyces liangshanensis]|uniref:Uncharacterized protein n=1 Tax=Streptomyces liangshanensis TaxID=2717324 RepID=A0A6G9GZ26_9ACTN|nr:hypothetical protein [Streptomyces liangshanensis]QIQ03470.1 hypothetical protein HA039_14990 [Streptomyces liangshanensis]
MLDPATVIGVMSYLVRSSLRPARWYVRYAPGTLGKAPAVAQLPNAGLRDRPQRTMARTVFRDRFEVDTVDLIQR